MDDMERETRRVGRTGGTSLEETEHRASLPVADAACETASRRLTAIETDLDDLLYEPKQPEFESKDPDAEAVMMLKH